MENLQVVYKGTDLDLSQFSNGAAIEVVGILQKSKKEGQSCEIHATEINLLAPSSEDFPIKNQHMTTDYLRSVSHQKHRCQMIHAISIIKKEITFAIQKFFYQKNFFCIFPPIFTTNSCEGGSDVFELSKDGNDFFKKKTLLSVSGQFYAEASALGLKNVYLLSPVFRAEKSNSSHHLAEFWMLEAEMSFTSLKEMLVTIEELIKFTTQSVLKNCMYELQKLKQLIPENDTLITKLEDLVNKSFQIVEYSKAIEILQEHIKEKKVVFLTNKIEFGSNLQSEHERYLCEEVFKSPIFVINYPKAIKAFYMKQNSDDKTVSAVDLLFPEVGELVGGSERETDIELIKKSANFFNISLENLEWYLNLRKYGYHKSSGFGLGFERLVMYFTGIKNIKEAVSFPRSYQQINF